MHVAAAAVNIDLMHDYYFALEPALVLERTSPALELEPVLELGELAPALALACAFLPIESSGSSQLVSDSHVHSCPLSSAD
mmetsp:Transcript_24917/g.45116  ORF Transcript_24917/g.45116 Transcript_24917/m.45116 type:complete len:81 (+) Transcript_24917:278-520(+)